MTDRCKKPKNSKRGSYIAEAAIVLPFIILSIISCVLIVMGFYDDVSSQCETHMMERAGTAATEDSASPAEKTAGVSYIRKQQLARRLANIE